MIPSSYKHIIPSGLAPVKFILFFMISLIILLCSLNSTTAISIKKIVMGAGTYTQIYIQVILAVKGRESIIKENWEEDLYKYISGIIQNNGQKMLAINGAHDHIHLLIGMKPSCCLSDLVREIKKSTNSFIKEKKFTQFRFEWQEGYGAFSYSHSSLNNVIKYILNQKEHHKKKSFKEEYISFLNKFQVDFKEDYLFSQIDE